MRKTALLLLLGIYCIILPGNGLSEETITITTYYPSPYGSYNELRANQMSIGSDYADDTLSNGYLIVRNRVGIGTPVPAATLDVSGPIYNSDTGTASRNILYTDTGGAGAPELADVDGFSIQFINGFFGANLDALVFRKTDSIDSVPDGGIAFVNQGSSGSRTAMAIRGDGNVGIGTNAPTGTLVVNGGTAAANADGRDITLAAEDGGTGNTDGGNIILLPGARQGTGTSGRVGINTNNPQSMLHVVGSVRISGLANAQAIKADAQGDLSAATLDSTVVTKSLSGPVNFPGDYTATPTCPAGYTLTGGGYDYGRVWGFNGIRSSPNAAGTGWDCRIGIPDTGACSSGTEVTACWSNCYAICSRIN